MAKLGNNRYGKSRVRVMKVTRDGYTHRVRDWTVQILVQGSFDSCFTEGDNSQILPTDTMKNTVYSLARSSSAASMEEFGMELAAFILARNPQILVVEVEIVEKGWTPAADSTSAFKQSGPERYIATVESARGRPLIVRSGVLGLVILKTAKSGFVGFIKDSLTTLPETEDRLFCTEADIEWTYGHQGLYYDEVRAKVLAVLLATFAEHNSLSVQHTLYAMGEAALAAEPALSEITLTMPNRHCLLVNLSPFGKDNPNEIFVPTDEPHGTIEATVTRT